jgi:hypothetical protein
MDEAVRSLRTRVFSSNWPLDAEISKVAGTVPSHSFLNNPAGQYSYVSLTRFMKTLSEQRFKFALSDVSVLDRGCDKGHGSKLLRDLGANLESCDILSDKDDSAFGQAAPVLRHIPLPSFATNIEFASQKRQMP